MCLLNGIEIVFFPTTTPLAPPFEPTTITRERKPWENLVGFASCPSSIMAALGEDLLVTVNKLQDLVFNTIGNDSLDLPQIVRFTYWARDAKLI